MTYNSPEPTSYSKIGASIIASWAASYAMTQLSLHGVDFTEAGINSEIVKSTIIGALVGFFTWLTPKHLVQSVTDAIIFCRNAIKEWRDALNNSNK